MAGTGASLITAFDYAWARLTERLPLPGFLDEHYQNWRSGLAALGPDEWTAPLGPSWGPHSESNTVDLALHVLDEVVHHGAEVGLLRDLFAHRSSLRG